VPALTGGKITLLGLKKKRIRELGAIVYIGQEIDESDLSTRAAKTGAIPDPSDASTSLLIQYIEALQTVKIGNIVRLSVNAEGGISLEVVARSPSEYAKNHPPK
jgi:hypothetical protein